MLLVMLSVVEVGADILGERSPVAEPTNTFRILNFRK